ncbi:MAG: MFS transporter, partial [Planctomycetota bacterium]
PAGEAVFPIAGVLLMAQIGWRETWLLIAGGVFVVVIPLVLWLLRGHHARHAEHLEHLELLEQAAREAEGAEGAGVTRTQWTRREVLRDARFYLLLPAVMAPGFIVTGLFFHQVHLVETKGWELAWFAGTFAVFAGTQLPCGLLAGPLVDRFGAARLLPLFLLPMTLSLVVLAMGTPFVVAILFMALAGVTGGLGSPIVGSMWAEVYGVRHLGAIRAMVTAILVFGTAGSPVTMGWLIDAGVTMETISWLCAAYCVVATALAFVALRRR